MSSEELEKRLQELEAQNKALQESNTSLNTQVKSLQDNKSILEAKIELLNEDRLHRTTNNQNKEDWEDFE